MLDFVACNSALIKSPGGWEARTDGACPSHLHASQGAQRACSRPGSNFKNGQKDFQRPAQSLAGSHSGRLRCRYALGFRYFRPLFRLIFRCSARSWRPLPPTTHLSTASCSQSPPLHSGARSPIAQTISLRCILSHPEFPSTTGSSASIYSELFPSAAARARTPLGRITNISSPSLVSASHRLFRATRHTSREAGYQFDIGLDVEKSRSLSLAQQRRRSLKTTSRKHRDPALVILRSHFDHTAHQLNSPKSCNRSQSPRTLLALLDNWLLALLPVIATIARDSHTQGFPVGTRQLTLPYSS
ncbi:hypothetical protein LIA77_04674 [Sarocladium implicatum]|nr:hypothetical protein LIA77_04674 [Sarocladium implicatum]